MGRDSGETHTRTEMRDEWGAIGERESGRLGRGRDSQRAKQEEEKEIPQHHH